MLECCLTVSQKALNMETEKKLADLPVKNKGPIAVFRKNCPKLVLINHVSLETIIPFKTTSL